MATIASGDIYETKVYCSLGAQIGINVLHYRCSATAGTSTTDLSFATALEAAVADAYRDLLVNDARFRGVGVKRLFPTPPTIEITSTVLADNGLVDGVPLPKQTCGIITKQTASAGRAFRGRVYVPFPGDIDNTGEGAPINTYVARLTALAGILEGSLLVGTAPNTAQMQPIIYHRGGLAPTDVFNCFGRPRWGTQRRRGDYGPTNAITP